MKIPNKNNETMSEIYSKNEQAYRVERILDVRGRGRKTEYLIKWLGYDDSHNTWEPPNHLKGAKEILDGFRSQRVREQIRKYQIKKTDGFTVHDVKDYKNNAKMAQSIKKNTFVTPVPENLEDLSAGTKKNDEGTDTEIIEEIYEKADTYKKAEKIKVSKELIAKAIEADTPVKNKMTSAGDKNLKKIVKTISTDVDESRQIVNELFNYDKLNTGTKYTTSDQITDPNRKQALRNDIRKANGVRCHVHISNKLYFILSWSNKNTDKFYSRHYFNFYEIEVDNPNILINYLKTFLQGAYI